MTAKKIWMDGELVDWDQATVHVTAYGLHYGLGFFEGIRCQSTPTGPAIFRLTDHLRRSGFIIMRARPTRPHSAG